MKEGQIIAEMDKVTLESELASARAAYDGSKAEYDYQSRIMKGTGPCMKNPFISDTDYEQSLYNYEMARSSFHSSKPHWQRPERNLSYATITSPIDGVVIDRAVEEGQTVAAGFETPTLFTIAADLTRMQVVADVDEADIGGVADGQRVTFTVDAYPDDVFEGKVTQIRLGSSEKFVYRYIHDRKCSHIRSGDIGRQPGTQAEAPAYRQHFHLYHRPSRRVVCAGKSIEVHPSGTSCRRRCRHHGLQCREQGLDPFRKYIYCPCTVTTGITNGIMTEILGGIDEGTEIVTGIEFGMPSKGMKPASGERSPFMPGPPGENKDKNGKRADDGKQESDRARDIRRNFQVGTKPSMPLRSFVLY